MSDPAECTKRTSTPETRPLEATPPTGPGVPVLPLKPDPRPSPEASVARPPLPLRGHVPELDGLRGVAILLVLLWHFWKWLGPIAQGGWIGVDLFFVLSGFLITGILLETKSGPRYFRNFYARRFLRIFPLYYAFLTIVFVSYWMFRTGTSAQQVLRTAGSPAWYYAYLSNFLMAFRETRVPLVLGHLWSLAVEEHFYLFVPLLVYRLSQRRLAYVLAGMIVTAILVRLGLFIVFPHKWMAPYTITPARMDALAFGCLCALLARSPYAHRVRAWSPMLFIVAAVSFLGLAMVTGMQSGDVVMRTVGYSVIAFAFALVLVGVLAHRGTRLTAPLRNPVLQYIGTVSYGIYIFHIFAGAVTRKALTLLGIPFTLGLGLSMLYMVVAIGVATVSWYTFEKPILRLKRYFESPARG